MSELRKLDAFEILDSRGNPTIQVTATLGSGAQGIAKIPSGASTGKKEAVELRDQDARRYGGKGVLRAVKNVTDELHRILAGIDGQQQAALDEKLVACDGTSNKARLGANATLGVSLAVAKAAAAEKKVPLYVHLSGGRSPILPVPMLNVLNGGKHADNNVDFQEFMIAPIGAPTFAEALRAAVETFHALKSVLQKKGYNTGVGDEGGFAPQLRSNEEPMELLLQAIAAAGYKPGTDIGINLDPAASEFFEDGRYVFKKSDGSKKTSEQMVSLWEDWLKRYGEILSLEDGLAEDDWQGWKNLTQRVGGTVQLVGDDIFVTNPRILQKGINEGIANSVLIKLNQIGTVTETLDCIELAKKHGYTAVISHRSGETDDTAIADLAVATGVGQIKTGSACRGERVSKYNRLLEIEHELGTQARYAGAEVYSRWRTKATARA